MTEIFNTLVNTPIPTILVISGLGFLVLSLSGKLSAHISVKEERRKLAMLCGVVLLVSGIGMQAVERVLSPPDSGTGEPIPIGGGDGNTQNGGNDDGRLTDPETAVWLLQFGNYSSRSNAEREKERLETAGFTDLTIVESGHYPALTKAGFYVITRPMKQSEIATYKSEIVEKSDLEDINYWVRNGFAVN